MQHRGLRRDPGRGGPVGSREGFFYAGARSLLVSNWNVESKPTVKLTTGLIRGLAANPGIGRAEALRRSILAMIDDTQDPGDTHPIAWAPFVLAGEGGAGRQRYRCESLAVDGTKPSVAKPIFHHGQDALYLEV